MILLLVILWLLLSLFVANLGRNRIIGFGGAFLICVLTSPLVGLLVILYSPKVKKMEEKITDSSSKADDVSRQFKELEDKVATSVISRKEYLTEKQKLVQTLLNNND